MQMYYREIQKLTTKQNNNIDRLVVAAVATFGDGPVTRNRNNDSNVSIKIKLDCR